MDGTRRVRQRRAVAALPFALSPYRRHRVTTRDALIAGSCGIMLIAAVAFLMRMPGASGGVWLATLWATWLASAAWALIRRPFPVIFAALMLSEFVFIVMPATAAQLHDAVTLAGDDFQAGIVPALRIAVLAQAAMLAAPVVACLIWPSREVGRITVALSPARLDKAAVAAVLTGAAGVVAMSVLGGAPLRDFFTYATSGGYGTFWRETHANLSGLVAVQCAAGLAVVLLPLRLAAGRARAVPLAVAACAALVLLGSGVRGPFVAAVTAAGLVWLKTSARQRGQRRLLVGGALVLLAVTGVLGILRGAAANRDVTVSTVATQASGPGNNLFLPLAGLAETVPAQVPYLHGASYLQVLVLPVPRALWRTKPADDITTVTTVFDPRNAGLAFPAFGEGYANFGLAGTALCGMLVGAVAWMLDRRLAGTRDVRTVVMAAVEGGVFLQLFSRGDFAPTLTTYAGFLIAAWWIGRGPGRAVLAGPYANQASSSAEVFTADGTQVVPVTPRA